MTLLRTALRLLWAAVCALLALYCLLVVEISAPMASWSWELRWIAACLYFVWGFYEIVSKIEGGLG